MLSFRLSSGMVLCVICLSGSLRAADWQVTSPAKDDAWAAGSPHYITWTTESLKPDAKLQIASSADDGASWSPIVTDAPNSGKFLWSVPDKESSRLRVRISLAGSDRSVESGDFRIGPSQAVPSYQWKLITAKAAFAPRDGAGALTFAGKMWFLGGWNPGDKTHFPRICNNEVWSSADGAEWTLVRPNTFLDAKFDPTKDWEGRHTAGYAVYRDELWIVGGDVNQGHYQNDVWNSSDGKSWTFVNAGKPVPWGPRALHYTLVHRDKIWVMGGQTMPAFSKSDEMFYRDIWTTTDGIDWQKIEPKEPYWSPRGMVGGSAVLNDRMWFLGGGTYDTPKTPTRQFQHDVWSSADGVTWTRHVEHAPWDPRQYHDVAVFDDRLWVMEGYGGRNRNDVWYSADGVNWYEVPKTPWKPRHAASVFVHDNALWMVAGNNMESDVWKLVKD